MDGILQRFDLLLKRARLVQSREIGLYKRKESELESRRAGERETQLRWWACYLTRRHWCR